MGTPKNFLSGKRIFEREVGINTLIQKAPSKFPSFDEYLKCAELGDKGIHYIIKSLEKIREEGYLWVDFNSYGYHWISLKNLEQLRKHTLSLGLKPFSIHSQQFKPEHLPFTYRKICRLTIEIAKILSVKCITYHPFPVVNDKKLNTKTVFDWNAEIVRYLGEKAKSQNIKIAIENVSSFFPDVGSIISLIEYVSLSNLGICLDTGHANLLNTIPEKEIEKAGGYLIQTHLNDNYGKRGARKYGTDTGPFGDDLHRLPGEGNINWKKVAHALETIKFPGPLMFEVSILPNDNPDEVIGNCWSAWLVSTKREREYPLKTPHFSGKH